MKPIVDKNPIPQVKKNKDRLKSNQQVSAIGKEAMDEHLCQRQTERETLSACINKHAIEVGYPLKNQKKFKEMMKQRIVRMIRIIMNICVNYL